ncbi:hypothetical protein BpHYR1_022309 [Brachionus plicatilis]|uniref:Uncharacterized protein n=1 Tax=Brachionus plicatilis TaxID=10195 RepID=A0A3M7S4W0_BRAPC|nr:hypothetical protein BpHYR1_022309 [Brachionus plicatilis]
MTIEVFVLYSIGSKCRASNIGLNLAYFFMSNILLISLSGIEQSIDKIDCIENQLIPVVQLLVYSRGHKGIEFFYVEFISGEINLSKTVTTLLRIEVTN